MSDKVLIQQELAESMAGLVDNLSKERALLFHSTFMETIMREWAGTDRLR